MGNNLLLVGDGGHCKSIIDSLIEINEYENIGIISKEKSDFSYLGIKCIGNDKDLVELYKSGWKNAFISLGSVDNAMNRKRLFSYVSSIGFNLPNIIDKTSIIAHNCKFGKGNYFGKGTIINSNAMIDDCCIINTGSIVEHDCKIGEFVHLSPNVCLCGNCTVGNNTHIGASTVVKQGTIIGSNTIIGIGSVVVKNIESNVVAYGNPCKVINKI